ncbi:hypothetical protein D5R81_12050 [Parashewanella spongiae]|uniref:Uncharacterized protein n=1 Tax=Parashewanella spongiae TaxID=342950 RepID=A0A3A6TX69_9GAMM|nr:hypothetical protein [Parashewanella spongiae]MCL1078633.1 hypothetical protein [Parashewanella spongiae]RJY12974.1 hypothetical protein D5R81_12050 [Parashewanella spongiae]
MSISLVQNNLESQLLSLVGVDCELSRVSEHQGKRLLLLNTMTILLFDLELPFEKADITEAQRVEFFKRVISEFDEQCSVDSNELTFIEHANIIRKVPLKKLSNYRDLLLEMHEYLIEEVEQNHHTSLAEWQILYTDCQIRLAEITQCLSIVERIHNDGLRRLKELRLGAFGRLSFPFWETSLVTNSSQNAKLFGMFRVTLKGEHICDPLKVIDKIKACDELGDMKSGLLCLPSLASIQKMPKNDDIPMEFWNLGFMFCDHALELIDRIKVKKNASLTDYKQPLDKVIETLNYAAECILVASHLYSGEDEKLTCDRKVLGIFELQNYIESAATYECVDGSTDFLFPTTGMELSSVKDFEKRVFVEKTTVEVASSFIVSFPLNRFREEAMRNRRATKEVAQSKISSSYADSAIRIATNADEGSSQTLQGEMIGLLDSIRNERNEDTISHDLETLLDLAQVIGANDTIFVIQQFQALLALFLKISMRSLDKKDLKKNSIGLPPKMDKEPLSEMARFDIYEQRKTLTDKAYNYLDFASKLIKKLNELYDCEADIVTGIISSNVKGFKSKFDGLLLKRETIRHKLRQCDPDHNTIPVAQLSPCVANEAPEKNSIPEEQWSLSMANEAPERYGTSESEKWLVNYKQLRMLIQECLRSSTDETQAQEKPHATLENPLFQVQFIRSRVQSLVDTHLGGESRLEEIHWLKAILIDEGLWAKLYINLTNHKYQLK